jgi:hypothetical protein
MRFQVKRYMIENNTERYHSKDSAIRVAKELKKSKRGSVVISVTEITSWEYDIPTAEKNKSDSNEWAVTDTILL